MKRRANIILSLTFLCLAVLWGCGGGGSSSSSGGNSTSGNNSGNNGSGGNNSGGNSSGSNGSGGQNSGTSTGVGTLLFTVQWPSAAQSSSGAQSVRVVLSANGTTLAQQVVSRPTAAATTSSITFSNQPAEQITANATSYSLSGGSGSALASAAVVVNLTPNATVSTPLSFSPTIASVSISPTPIGLITGSTTTLAASALDANGNVILTTGSDWSWSSSNTGVATIGASGVTTTLTAVSAGTSSITLQETTTGKTISVVAAVSNFYITLAPPQVTLAPGGTQQFTVSTTLGSLPVTWKVQEGSAGGSVDTNGVYTAPATTGTYHVIAIPLAYPAFSGSATITVSAAVPGAGYTITNLGAVTMTGLNASGQTSGFVTDNHGMSTIVRGAPSGSVVNLGGDPNGTTFATGINSSGQISGYSNIGNGSILIYSFRTTATGSFSDGTATLFGSTSGVSTVEATGINDSGQMTGWHGVQTNLGGLLTAFRSTPNSAASPGITDLGALVANQASQGWAINAIGQVTGSSTTANGGKHAFRTTATGTLFDGTATDLGVLPGNDSTTGTAINSSGQVVGYADYGSGITHAFRTTATGTLTDGTGIDLGTLGGTKTVANGINDSGDVVGYSYLADNVTQHAFVYTDHMIDLNTQLPANSGITVTNAVAINSSGQILVTYYTNSVPGQQSAILTPISSKAARKLPAPSQQTTPAASHSR